MNPHVERAALRARSWMVARRRPRPTLVRRACSLRWWWLRIAALALVVPLVALRWVSAQMVGFGLVLAGWRPIVDAAADPAPVRRSGSGLRLAAVDGVAVKGDPVEPARPVELNDIAARHALLDRVEAIQAREAAQTQAQGYCYMVPRRRFRVGRALRALAVTTVAVLAGWWLFLFSAAAIGSYAPLVNGPHGVQLPGAATGATR